MSSRNGVRRIDGPHGRDGDPMNEHRRPQWSERTGRRDQGEDSHRVDRTATPVLGVLTLPARSKRILVVEDDPDMADTICELLCEQGYQTESASSGADAIAKVRAMSPALVILDMGLPDQDGVQVALELVADRRTAQLPVLFVSGRGDLAARVRECRQLNCDFLRKPYHETELLARVERCLAESDLRARLESDARIDELTGLGNPRLLHERLGVEAARRARYGTPLTILVMDLDGLKQINDRHGHLTGTAVLREVGAALRREIRETDVAFRYGGDEFVVLLPHTGMSDALAFSERLLEHIRTLRPSGIAIAVSIGVAAYDDNVDDSIQAQLARADSATYDAKRLGGDRIVASQPLRATSPP
jgi:diguanylate cyclase (GGDEF)-like protein